MGYIPSAWFWIAGGLALMVLELVAPGVFMVWFALAALATGVVLFVVPLSTSGTLLVFSTATLVSVLIGRKVYGRRVDADGNDETLNAGTHALIGRSIVLEQPIEHGSGHIRVDDTLWRVEAPQDLPAGARVKVTGAEGTVLRVVAA